MKLPLTPPQWVQLFFCISFCLGIGGLSGYITASEIQLWYTSLQKPSWNPPNWVFSPVWTSLYCCMGISWFLVWAYTPNSTTTQRNTLLALFAFQLFFNALWSIIFFKWHSPIWAFTEIVVLWLCILAYLVKSYHYNKWASYLFIPYWLWVSFAAFLNYTLWQLNP